VAELLYRLGRFAARRAGWVIAAWALIIALAAGSFVAFFGGLSNSFDIPGTASSEVIDDLQEQLPEYSGAAGMVVFHTEDGEPFTAEQQQQISDLVADQGDLVDVADVVDPFDAEAQRAEQRAQLDDGQTQLDAGFAQLDAGQQQLDAAREQLEAFGAPAEQLAALDTQQQQLDAQRLEAEAQQRTLDNGLQLVRLADGIRVVSEDGTTAVVNVAFTEPRLELSDEAKQSVVDHYTAEKIDGVEVAFSTEIAQGVPQVVGVSEAIGVVIAAIVLIVMLGSLLAASFPIITALTGVAVGVLASLSLSGVITMASVTPVLGIMLGLAVGIDYALFIVNRHRRQLLEGADVHESIGLANGTAGTAVVFAGTTVIVALLALFVTGIPFLGLMGAVGAFCVAVAVLIAITLTPALLGLAGTRMLGRRGRRQLAAGPVAHDAVAVKPMSWLRSILTIVLAVAALLACAIPAASMRLGLPDGGSEPHDSTTYRAFELIDDAFGQGANSPLLVTVDTMAPPAEEEWQNTSYLAQAATTIADLDGVAAVAPIAQSELGLWAFQVIPETGPNSEATEQLVRELRENRHNTEYFGVAGQAAINIDISENLAEVLPLYLLVVVGLSVLIMILVFRSLLVPIIATGGFILSLLATFGGLVAVFQWGWGASIFGITTTMPILSFLPVILVGILFGLAMDYQLFLASGMREAHVHGAPARLAVAQGFRAGRSVVIAAGLIMVAVFGGFVFSESVIIRQLGFGLAVGVLLDAFVVRLLLMPAIMHVLGRSAWWIPLWLDRILPNVDVEGAALERRHHGAA